MEKDKLNNKEADKLEDIENEVDFQKQGEQLNPQVQAVTPAESPVDKSGEMLQVPFATMQRIIDQLDAQDKEIKALGQTVSKTRLEEARSDAGEDKRARVHFKVMEGKPIVGWPETIGTEKVNEIIFNPATNMPVGEILKSVFYFADGTKTELIDQSRFTRLTNLAYARVVLDEDDYGTLEFEDKTFASQPIRIHKKYWNA